MKCNNAINNLKCVCKFNLHILKYFIYDKQILISFNKLEIIFLT